MSNFNGEKPKEEIVRDFRGQAMKKAKSLREGVEDLKVVEALGVVVE